MALFSGTTAFAQKLTREEYVERYKHIAIAHMERYGIPASITMAQGILESSNGNSFLAQSSNNHFGIKCKKDWLGETFHYDDDEKDECFRKYPSVEESYRDHAEFLDSQPRYDSLFVYPSTDYRSWARGLKAAGYATAPDYADRLIRVIEENKLYLLDKDNGSQRSSRRNGGSKPNGGGKADKNKSGNSKTANKSVAKFVATKAAGGKTNDKTAGNKTNANKSNNKAVASAKTDGSKAPAGKADNKDATSKAKPAAYVTKTYVKQAGIDPDAYRVTINAHKGYNVYRTNNVCYVIAKKGDRYENIASLFQISAKSIRRFNDVAATAQPAEGDMVFIEHKRRYWEGDAMLHKVQRGETLYALSQAYGIRLKSLSKINKLRADTVLPDGYTVKLR